MATAKTGAFYLTETVVLPIASASGDRVQGEIDTGAYVSIANGQALAIDSVDFIYQVGADFGQDASSMIAVVPAGGACIAAQVTDLNPGTAFVRADNQSLVASSGLNIDQPNNIGTAATDFYPDSFGPGGLSDSFLCVNDSLFLVAGVDGNPTGGGLNHITARIRCRVVKLSTKDWMAIAIQSTASDN